MVSRLKLFAPLMIFAVMALFLFRGLGLDPNEMPSALIDQPLPAFRLPDLAETKILTRGDVVGQVSLLNVWATWCGACRVEHPYLLSLSERGIPIYGVSYKDDDSDARKWLRDLGDPYRLNITDREGMLGLDLGVYGAPETYLLDAAGVIRYRHVGILDQQVWDSVLGPLYRSLQTGAGDQ